MYATQQPRNCADFECTDFNKVYRVVSEPSASEVHGIELKLTLGTWDEGEEEVTLNKMEISLVDEDHAVEFTLLHRPVRFECMVGEQEQWRYGTVSEIIDTSDGASFVVQDTRDDSEYILHDIEDLTRVSNIVLAVGPCYGVLIKDWSSTTCQIKENMVEVAIQEGKTTSKELQSLIHLQSTLGLTDKIKVYTQDNVWLVTTPRTVIDYYCYAVHQIKPRPRSFNGRFRDFLSVKPQKTRSKSQSVRASSVSDTVQQVEVQETAATPPTEDAFEQFIENFSTPPPLAPGAQAPVNPVQTATSCTPIVTPAAPAPSARTPVNSPVLPMASNSTQLREKIEKFRQVRTTFGESSDEWRRFWNSNVCTLSADERYIIETALHNDRYALNSLVSAVASSSKAHKNNFKPTDAQKSIHAALVHQRHQGKPPMLHVESQMGSDSVVFKAEPGVLTRLYDWRFERWGLSITHFKPMDHYEKRLWGQQSGIDLTNFSTKAFISPKPSVKDWSDIIDSLEALQVYADEYFNSSTSDVIRSASRFARAVKLDERKLPVDLTLIQTWIDETFAMFRMQLANLTPNIPAIQGRFDVNNFEWIREVNIALFRQLSVQKPWAMNPTAPTFVPIPSDVLKLIPQKNGKNLCLKYLSVQGCNGQQAICLNKDRVHFIPAALDDAVKAIITARYGGFRAGLTI